jgi:uridine kinase
VRVTTMSHPVAIAGNGSLGRSASAGASAPHHAPPPGSPEAMASLDASALTRRMLSFELGAGACHAGRARPAVAACAGGCGRQLAGPLRHAPAGLRHAVRAGRWLGSVPSDEHLYKRIGRALRRAKAAAPSSPNTAHASDASAARSAGAAGSQGSQGTATPGSPAPPPGTRDPFVIGVCGGTASGKTTVCDRIMHQLQERRVVLISQARAVAAVARLRGADCGLSGPRGALTAFSRLQDSFYRGLTPDELANVKEYNFDHPDAMDQEAIVQCLVDLKARRTVYVPIYDFKTHSRAVETQKVEPGDVIIFEGILTLAMDKVRELANMKIFVDTDDDVRLARRIKRDTCDRGRDVHGVIEQYTKFVKPMFDAYVSPSKKYADVIIPWAGGENGVAIDLIVQHIRIKLGQEDLRRIFSNLKLLPSNFQIRGMHTIIRDKMTARNDFVFYSDRLIRLVVEHGLGYLPFTECSVATPTGHQYGGVEFSNKLCGVSIIRSGESMENALRACCKGVKIGKILIQREGDTGPCKIIYQKLPLDISTRYVLLLDPILASGNSALAAIEKLVECGVAQERIIFLTLIAAPQGVHRVCERYPRLTLVTSEVDSMLSANHVVLPGIGEFGDSARPVMRASCLRMLTHRTARRVLWDGLHQRRAQLVVGHAARRARREARWRRLQPGDRA